MTAYVDLDGLRVISGRVTLPYYGIWTADVLMASTETIPNNTTLTVGNLALACKVIRGASFAGSRSARIVGGAGGWRTTISAQSYYSASGLKTSTLLGDAAKQVGEKLSIQSSADVVVGSSYSRENAPAVRLLRALAGIEWWMAPNGVTNVGTRPSTAITSPFQVVKWSGGKGWFTVASEDIASWVPGNTFTTPLVSTTTIGMTEIVVDNKGTLRLTVLSAQ